MARVRDQYRKEVCARCGLHRGGFTLIELIMLIVILGILAGVAIPNMSKIPEHRISIAAKQLLRDISYAREQAILTGNRMWVVIDDAAETYSILAENPLVPGRIGATSVKDPATGLDYTVTLATEEFFDVEIVSANFDGAAEVGFDWLGRPLNNTEVALILTGEVVLSGGQKVTVNKGTGVVSHVP